MNLSVRVLAAFLALACWGPPSVAQPHTVAAVRADRTNLRAKPSTDAEVLASLHKGELLEVLGEEAPAGQKEIWSRVLLPSSVSVWVYSPGVDKAGVIRNETMNFRAGPGRNYSVLGSLRRGDSVTIIREFDGWLQIAPPRGTTAYVASRLLGSPESPTPRPSRPQAPQPGKLRNLPEETSAPAPPDVASSPSPVRESDVPAGVSPSPAPSSSAESPAPQPPRPASDAPFPDPAWASIAKPVGPESKSSVPESTTLTPTPPPLVASPPSAPPTQPAVPDKEPSPTATAPESKPVVLPPRQPGSPRDQLGSDNRKPVFPLLTSDPDPGRPKPGTPLPTPREVTRDGVVRITWSPQAPSDYELQSLYSGEGLLDYLYLEPQSDLKKFAGRQVRVQGEEYLDSRWRTPVLKVKTIELNP